MRTLSTLLVGLMLLALFFCPQIAQAAAGDAGATRNAGPDRRQLEELRRELSARLDALSEKPDDPLLNHMVAFKYYEMGDFAQARRYWNSALQADPSFAKAHFNLGEIDFREGKAADAVARWTRVLELQTDDAKELYASCHYNLGCVEYNRGIDLSEKGDAPGARAAFERAVAECRQATELNPKHYKAYVNLGLALVELGRDREAAQAWEAATAIVRDSFYANYNLALLEAMAGDYQRAKGLCELALAGEEGKAQSDADRAGVYYALGEIYFDLNDLDASIEAFRKSVELDSSSDNEAKQRLRAVMRRRARGGGR